MGYRLENIYPDVYFEYSILDFEFRISEFRISNFKFGLCILGGATIELELALAEGAGLRGGYSTPDTLKRRDRFKMEKIELKESNQFR